MFKQGITIWYNVSDIKVSKSFYEEKLSFECKMFDEEGGMVIMGSNTDHVEIGFSQANEVEPSSSSTVFTVDNIEETVEALKAKGVEFQGGIDVVPGMVKLATFADPDGHSLMLAEDLTDE